MKKLISISCIFYLLGGACSKTEEENRTNASGQEGASGEQSSNSGDFTIEDSASQLKSHSTDLKEVAQVALDLGFEDIANNANTLATTYDFTVQPKLNNNLFAEASFEWVKAELYFDRMEVAYNQTADETMSAAWKTYLDSREVMLDLKVLWDQVTD